MILRIYEEDTTKDKQTLLAFLPDCISCIVTEERNGIYELYMQYPVSGSCFDEIQLERCILVKPNCNSDDQFFRIYRITKPLDGICSIYAQHISYDLSGYPIMPMKLNSATPAYILDTILNDTGFAYETDLSTSKSYTITEPRSVRACLGGTDGSMLDLWHGEFEFDNFKVIYKNSRGADRGVSLEYGRNLTALEHDSDLSDIYSSVTPYAVKDDKVITLSEKNIPLDGSSIDREKSLILDLTNEFEQDETITETKLREKAKAYIGSNINASLVPTVTVSFEPESVNNDILDMVLLCDTVTVRYTQYGIEAKAKVIRTEFDSLSERYVSITVGNAKSSMGSTIQQQIAQVSKKADRQVDKFASLLESAIDEATDSITGGLGGNVVIHRDESGKPYELLIMDTNDISTAQKVWRWNSGGLGYNSTGYAGPYTTAITSQGQIVANFITTGILTANILKAGTIASFDNSSYWNLENGDIKVTGDIVANSLTLPSSFSLPYSKVSGKPDLSVYAKNTDLTLYIKKDGTIGSNPSEGSTGFKVSSAGLLQASNAVIYGGIFASKGRIANFEISGSEAAGNGFWNNALSVINVDADAGKQYATFVRAPSAAGNIAFGIKEMASSETSNSSNWTNKATYNFSVNGRGKLTANNADITDRITATSLTLNSGVTIPYNKISSTPDLSVYVAKDGTIGTTPASGKTGFKVSSAGLLQASNAVVYGTIYATAGKIGGWDISSTQITNTSADGCTVGIANFNNTEESSRVFYCLNTSTNKNVFRVNRNGHVEAADLKITGGSISIGSKFNVGSDGVCSASALTASGLVASDAVVTGMSLVGNLEMTSNSAIKMYCCNSWNIVFRYYNSAVCVGADSKILRLCGSAVYLGSSGTTAVTSDRNFKKDIVLLDEKMEKFFSKLRPVNYKYKDGHRTHTGFIAQDVKQAADDSDIGSEDLAAYVEIHNDDGPGTQPTTKAASR